MTGGTARQMPLKQRLKCLPEQRHNKQVLGRPKVVIYQNRWSQSKLTLVFFNHLFSDAHQGLHPQYKLSATG